MGCIISLLSDNSVINGIKMQEQFMGESEKTICEMSDQQRIGMQDGFQKPGSTWYGRMSFLRT